MGIKTSALAIISRIKAKDVLSLSYPDLVMTVDECYKVTGIRATNINDSNKWHRKADPFPETIEVFSKLGMTLTCVDIVASRDVETVVDLNYPQDLGQFDLVLDCGTTEHCFNIGQALMNAANAVKEGGYILHTPPLNMINHGFYCLQPTLFYDFYTQNGWDVEFIAGELNNEYFDIPAIQRVTAPSETSLIVLAKRLNNRPLIYPMQSKYLANPELK